MKRSLPVVGQALASAVRAVDAVRPLYAVWEVTLRCDLGCQHCGSRAGRARPDELSTAEALQLVDELAELGVQEVTLIGGEATLRDDWAELVRAVRRAGMGCGITTGGRALGPALARELARAGVQTVSVSVDGLEATHDALRGVRGSFAAAMGALAALGEVGLQVSANTQVGRTNLGELPALFEALVGAGPRTMISAWQVQLTVAMGRAADGDLILQPYQLLELMPTLARLARRAKAAGVLFWPGNNLGYFGPHEAELRGHLGCGHATGCSAGRTTLGIEADGSIKGCPSLPSADYVGGNVREHPLREIWERAPALRFTRARTVADLWGECASCYYAETCMSGCSWTSHVLFGRPGNNPYCHHRALELRARGERERLRRVTPAPGLPFDQARWELVRERWPETEGR